jgi:hypothetical protein
VQNKLLVVVEQGSSEEFMIVVAFIYAITTPRQKKS